MVGIRDRIRAVLVHAKLRGVPLSPRTVEKWETRALQWVDSPERAFAVKGLELAVAAQIARQDERKTLVRPARPLQTSTASQVMGVKGVTTP